ncbi:MAG: hypothetical protein KA746_13815 [Pyrinomonadaceae bacterium]|nr:hypothetical protein [Pyrinomonadaceae bacterium]MBP6211769.1 hypothetical protein [Pyrinomonadaceae bacterium]
MSTNESYFLSPKGTGMFYSRHLTNKALGNGIAATANLARYKELTKK